MFKSGRIGKTERRKYTKKFVYLIFFAVIGLILGCGKFQEPHKQKNMSDIASQTLENIGVHRGICVVLADTLCELSLSLVSKSELVIYTQFSDPENVEAACQAADSANYYGTRVYVEKGELDKIHLADNLADAVIVMDKKVNISKEEILRVLHPHGMALIGDTQYVKPVPQGLDDWSHPYHGPDNNTQSKDQIARAPYLTQFMADPRYAPATQVAVASDGRIFKAFGNVAFHEREEPFLNKLVAFNGYNGTLLWKRDLVPGIMIHRNTMIATPSTLYLGDDTSCKKIDTKTGQIKDEIIPPTNIAGGTFWKWMGMENGVLYALLGKQEQKDAVMRWRRTIHGWPWDGISQGYNQAQHPWGFGHNVLAIDPDKKKVLWHYHEDEPIDSRAMCMKNDRLFLFHFGSYLTCLDAKSGKTIWRKTPKNDPELFKTLGRDLNRQSYDTNWRTTDYVMCSDEALYFSGPQIDKLVAVSAKDGRILWQNPYNNFQLVLRDEGLYGISGPWKNNVSKLINPLTGDILADLPAGRRACTRPNASADAIFYRASGGTVRFDIKKREQQWISTMRPPCHDGVTIANGMLYWGPFVCDCQLSIYGMIGVGPAGDFDFSQKANTNDRLERYPNTKPESEELLLTSADWPTFRQDNDGFAHTDATIAQDGWQQWRYPVKTFLQSGTDILGSPYNTSPTAPVTVDGLVYWSGTDGIVKCLDVQSGKLLWKAYTGGVVRFPPTVWKNKILVASGDGYVYNFDARTGFLNWRFRAAPENRKIPVYGSLSSTWPVASNVLVEDGVAYVAAGIVNYDGTHLFALDADNGHIIWQNSTSGHLLPEARTGVSVQGHMLIIKNKLYLASGTSLSPAIYDKKTGKCLNDPEPLKGCESNSPRGWELYRMGDKIIVGGKPFYSHPEHDVYDATVTNKILHSPTGDKDIFWVNQRKIVCYPHVDKKYLNKSVADQSIREFHLSVWGKLDIPFESLWEYNSEESIALAVCKNAVVIAERTQITVLDIRNGKTMWTQPLDYPPVPWGLALSRDGRIIVTLQDGSVQCFGSKPTNPTPYLSSNNTYFVGSALITLACNTKDTQIRYTLDGSQPDKSSPLYQKPFTLTNSTTLKMRALKKDAPPSYVVTEQFKKVEYQSASEPGNIKPGLSFDYYEGYCASVADLDHLKPVTSGIMMELKLQPRDRTSEFGYIFKGYILVPKEGIYTFYTKSNDGSRLYINNQQVVNNDGAHGAIEKSGQIALSAGEYPILVKYFQQGGGKFFSVSWEGPDMPKQEITAEVLFHKANSL